MPEYDAERFAPPAPVARVTIRTSERETPVTDVPMLLDTGADVSLVPRVAAEALALPEAPEASVQLLGFDVKPSTAPAYHLEMIFCDKVFRGRFLLIDEECGILGRNILNRLPILYDGPRLAWELRGPIPA